MPKKSLPLIEKYRAHCFSEIKGQDSVIQDIHTFFKMFPKKRAIILNGPVGTGKTSIALAAAKEYNLELFELNASDLRNRAKLEEILKPAVLQKSLFNKGKLILMDEADGITGTDRGGVPELIALIQKTSFPIIITANDIWDKKFSLLRQKCTLVNIKEVKEETIIQIIKHVLECEKKQVSLETQQTIAKKAKGDVRAAMNDLETVLTLGEENFIVEQAEREKQASVFDSLQIIFQNLPDENTLSAFDSTQMELDEILLWVEENIPVAYQGNALARAQFSLSLADVFRGRIYRQQYWRFLVYQNFFLTAGISAATKLKYKRFTHYKKPSRILKIWMANQKNIKKKSIVAKYARFTHMSKRKANKESFLLPLILNQIAQDKLDLEETEQTWLKEKKVDFIVANKLNKFRS